MCLHNLGFQIIHKEGGHPDQHENYSTDDGTYAVYEKLCKDGKIQISIVRDKRTKVKMYDLAMKRGWNKFKRGTTENWNELYKEVTG